MEDDNQRCDSLHQIINSLPDPNYATLRMLILIYLFSKREQLVREWVLTYFKQPQHLNRVQEQSKKNRINAKNIAACLGRVFLSFLYLLFYFLCISHMRTTLTDIPSWIQIGTTQLQTALPRWAGGPASLKLSSRIHSKYLMMIRLRPLPLVTAPLTAKESLLSILRWLFMDDEIV